MFTVGLTYLDENCKPQLTSMFVCMCLVHFNMEVYFIYLNSRVIDNHVSNKHEAQQMEIF